MIPNPPKTPSSPPWPAQLTSSANTGNLSRSTDNLDNRSIRSAPTQYPAQVTPQSLTEQLIQLFIKNKLTPMPEFSQSPASSQIEYHATTTENETVPKTPFIGKKCQNKRSEKKTVARDTPC